MNDSLSPWLPLVVDEGQPAQCTGRVIVFAGASHLQSNGTPHVLSEGSLVTNVPLRFAEAAPPLEGILHTLVVASGYWADDALNVEELTPLPLPADDTSGRRQPLGAFLATNSPPPLRDRVERSLLKEGSALDIEVIKDANGQSRRVVLARDVERVRTALAGRDDIPLEVIESRWSQAQLDGILNDIVSDEPLVCGFGFSTGPDRQMRVAVRVLRVTPQFQYRLDKVPADAIDLTCLVTPR